MKRLFISLLAFMLIITTGCTVQQSSTPAPTSPAAGTPIVSSSSAPIPAEETGFDSPEAAAQAYLEALRDGDLNRMISTFAIEHYSKNLDLEAAIVRAQSYSASMGVPNSNEIVASMNVANYRRSVVDTIVAQYNQLCSFESDQDISQTPQTFTDNDKAASDFVAQMNTMLTTPKLSTLRVLGFVPLEKLDDITILLGISNFTAKYYNDSQLKNAVEVSKISGADNAVSRVAVFEIDGNTYLMCLDAVEYGGKWFISQLGGLIGNAIQFEINLDHMYGLLPLFFANADTTAANTGINALKAKVLEVMNKVESGDAGAGLITAPVTYEGSGFDSPEDAAKAYLDALHDGDLNRMISSFAVESDVKNRDFEAYVNMTSSYDFSSTDIKFPNSSAFVASMSIETQKGVITNAMLKQYIMLCLTESGQYQSGSSPLQNQQIENETAAKELYTQINETLNTPKLATLDVLGFIPPEKFSDFSAVLGSLKIPDNYFNTDNQSKIDQRNKATYGADKTTGCIAVFEVDGNLYLLVFDAFKYASRWFVGQFGGNLSAAMNIPSSYSGLVPLSALGTDASIDVDKLREMLASMQ